MTDTVTPPTDVERTRWEHGLGRPPGLVALMAGGWTPRTLDGVTAHEATEVFADRRRRVAAEFPGERIVLHAGSPKVRANDTDYRFRPDSSFVWLTGCQEPGAAVVIEPSGEATLFVPEPAQLGTEAAFTDARRGELWIGRQPTVDEVGIRFGVPARALDALADTLSAGSAPVRDGVTDEDARRVLSELRMCKDDLELRWLQEAVDSTVLAFEDVVRAIPEALRHGERWLEGTFDRRARTAGNDTGYHTIVAGGANACTLHWNHNNGPIRRGDLLLLDAGVEGPELYTADITRTLPVSGTYGEAQRAIYGLVAQAQQEAVDAVRPGAHWSDPHMVAMRIIAAGLIDLGILRCSLDEALDPERAAYRRFTLHHSSHALGLDVHDCASAREEAYRLGTLRERMVLTVEPGCYLSPHDETVPAEFRGIGVRIEDDVVVTADAPRVLSAALPVLPHEVEAWMAGLLG